MSNMECGCMCSKRGEGGGSCITWDLNVAFHLLNAHVRRGGIDPPSGSVYPHSSGMCSKGDRGNPLLIRGHDCCFPLLLHSGCGYCFKEGNPY